MKPLQLDIQGFRSFAEKQSFEFSLDDFGFHFITGKNWAEPRLGANGAGKSSVWDALFWVLYDKTLRGLRAGDVANWNGGYKTMVSFYYEVSGNEYCVTRTWSPNSWYLTYPDGTKEDLVDDATNLLLREHLKLSPIAAMHCIFISQQKEMFLDLDRKQKTELLAEVLDLDKWLSYSDVAKNKWSDLLIKIKDTQSKITTIDESLSYLDRLDPAEQAKQWEKEKKEKLAELQKDLDAHCGEAADIQAEVSANPLPSATGEVENLRLALDIATEEAESAKKKESQLIYSKDHLLDEIKSLESGSGKCPTCGQLMPGSKEADRHIQVKQKELSKIVDLLEMAASQRMRSARRVTTQMAKIKELEDKNYAATMKHKNLLRELDSADRLIHSIRGQLDKLSKEVNPHQKTMDSIKESVQKAINEKRVLEQHVKEYQSAAIHFEFWSKEFKELRILAIANAIHQLEVESNASLVELGLENWQLRFDVEKETKSGTKQIGFSVMVLSPLNEKAVPWESWSGGESQRLRIAATMGMSNLIRSATGATLSLEVWDEPTQYLNDQGVQDLLECLRTRAEQESRQIYVVDHRSLGYGAFNSTTEVTKLETGSVIASK